MKICIIKPAINYTNSVMPDLIRHPVAVWIPAFAGMTTVCIFNCRVNSEKAGYAPLVYPHPLTRDPFFER